MNVGCLRSITGHCQRTVPCEHTCDLRVQHQPNLIAWPFHLRPPSQGGLTEADVRRIVREEIAKATKEPKP